MLGNDLDSLKSPDKMSANDRLHAANQREGRDKFKTLRKIRQGNTQQRVLDFENL